MQFGLPVLPMAIRLSWLDPATYIVENLLDFFVAFLKLVQYTISWL